AGWSLGYLARGILRVFARRIGRPRREISAAIGHGIGEVHRLLRIAIGALSALVNAVDLGDAVAAAMRIGGVDRVGIAAAFRQGNLRDGIRALTLKAGVDGVLPDLIVGQAGHYARSARSCGIRFAYVLFSPWDMTPPKCLLRSHLVVVIPSPRRPRC